MGNNIEEYMSLIKSSEEKTPLTREHLVTGVVINIKRIILELQELKDKVLSDTYTDDFSMLLLGTHLEDIKRQIIKIRQDFLKK